MVNEPFLFEVARGRHGAAMRKFGSNPDVGTTEEDVWDAGGSFPWQSSAVSLEVLSADGADAAAGTGARTVEVQGLDANWAMQTKTATLNGISAVAISGTWLRVFRMKVLSAGSGGKNVGALTCRVASGGDTQAMILVGYNQTLMALFTVPADQQAYMVELYFSCASSKTFEVALYVRTFGEVFQLKRLFHIYRQPFPYLFPIPLVIEPKSDIVVRATGSASGDPLSAGFTLWHEEDEVA